VCSAVTAICKRANVLQERAGQRTTQHLKKSKNRESKENEIKNSNCQIGRSCHWESEGVIVDRFQSSARILIQDHVGNIKWCL